MNLGVPDKQVDGGNMEETLTYTAGVILSRDRLIDVNCKIW